MSSIRSRVTTETLWVESKSEIRTRPPDVASVAWYLPASDELTSNGDRTMTSELAGVLADALAGGVLDGVWADRSENIVAE